MSTSPYSPTESSYWSSPRLKIPIKAVNLDFNHNVGVLQVAASGKSLSEPSSPQLWHKVSNTDHVEVHRHPEKNQAAHSGTLKTRQKHVTRKYSDNTELAELLAEHQERQLRSMQGLNTGIQQPWGSSLRLNELHMQTNASDNGLTGFTGQMPLNNGTTASRLAQLKTLKPKWRLTRDLPSLLTDVFLVTFLFVFDRREKQSLERYLKEVPTVEEYQKLNKTLKDVRDECEKLKETISAKDKKLTRISKAFGNKDDEAKKLTVENTTLKENMQRLQVSLDKISNDGPVSLINFEDLKMENERLQVELDRTKKVLENKHKKMKTLHCQTQKEQKSLEERLTQEEEMVHALRDELVAKENSLEEVRKAVKEIASHNQDLLEENLNLQCRCEQLQKLNSKEKLESQRKLWKELSECTGELKAVVQVCRERREGKDPDMSVLLGLRSTSIDEDESESKDTSDDVDTVKSKIDKVQQLRSDVEGLRKFISDQYAEDIGNNCRMH
ncbi:centrosomal protein of 85 kDa-like [Stylophora pistillata]|uniref:centrosomal protein of 85 kDa-like n=1 Tax=Stylophora pistillata TaxID=50429 RepID=UPI000C0502A1|nr:centrosomal protein of 85 kDa-like [Stylophora pistillata]